MMFVGSFLSIDSEDSEPLISYSELLRTIRMMDRIFAQLPARVCIAS